MEYIESLSKQNEARKRKLEQCTEALMVLEEKLNQMTKEATVWKEKYQELSKKTDKSENQESPAKSPRPRSLTIHVPSLNFSPTPKVPPLNRSKSPSPRGFLDDDRRNTGVFRHKQFH